jgi:L-aspartate oxidase
VTREIRTTCLVVGTGIAGLTTAMTLAEKGIDTVVISAANLITETNTGWAQGGIIFEGNRESLTEDILNAGCRSNYLPAVQQLVNDGPQLVRSILIDKAGVLFDQQDNEYHLTREGGHSENRILHRGDESGKSIENSLADYCRRLPNLKFICQSTAVNLLMSSYHDNNPSRRHERPRCFGAFIFDQTTAEVYPIFATHTILATGGAGQIYLHNTNSKFARGDGIALAHRAGCRLENLEYVQFHPTTFFHPSSPRFLISEALRGEGAVLINPAGERFLSKYIANVAIPELAPRDRVAKGIHQEMLSQGVPCVYLDLTSKNADWIARRFPFVYRSCLKYGIDIAKDPIPVVPGAHYHCGGVWVDLAGRTSIDQLWAVGEVACTGLHGANRLASTSLLEGLVWGNRAALTIARDLRERDDGYRFPEIEPWKYETIQVDASFISQDWLMLKHTMWNYVGLIKTDARLERAEGILTELSRGIEFFYRKALLNDELIGLRHAVLVAGLILKACRRNPRSLGCYQREDLTI